MLHISAARLTSTYHTSTNLRSSLSERVSAFFGWMHERAITMAPADRAAFLPAWDVESLQTHRMVSCPVCGEIISPSWKLCGSCGNATR